jgi:hypothetical protein
VSNRGRRNPTNALRVSREDWHAHVDGCRTCRRALHSSGELCSAGVSLFSTYKRRQRREQLRRGRQLPL